MTTTTVTHEIVDNAMQPITKQDQTIPRAVTGTWIYTRLNEIDDSADKARNSIMDIVRDAASSMALSDFHSSCKAANELAKADNELGVISDSRLQTIRNQTAVMKNAFAVLRFCNAWLIEQNIDTKNIGYKLMNEQAATILQNHSDCGYPINNDGSRAKTKDEKIIEQNHKLKMACRDEAIKGNKQVMSESDHDYYARIAVITDGLMQQKQQEMLEERNTMLAKKVYKILDNDVDLFNVVQHIITERFTVSVTEDLDDNGDIVQKFELVLKQDEQAVV